jgi:hypothetical protein
MLQLQGNSQQQGLQASWTITRRCRGHLVEGLLVEKQNRENKDESSIAVAVDSVFAPGFSNQKPFTEMVDATPASGEATTSIRS